ncbi:hypothetical protein [Tenacibaculum ovolyticum]|uniref:hypothetical protein n=1 Tax=Tenacibaculum ovolyticum TaxID=104270 RepID=UPI0007EC72C8|nr:hypothetical protein [Tenacibaculum ovolyticum]
MSKKTSEKVLYSVKDAEGKEIEKYELVGEKYVYEGKKYTKETIVENEEAMMSLIASGSNSLLKE